MPIEPRYKGGGSGSDGAVLTNNKPGSLKPDLVVHATRNASELQDSYQHLSRKCPVFLVMPAGLRPFEAP